MFLPRVFMVGWEFPPHNSGGLGTACAGLTAALSRLSVPQTFVLPKQLPVNVDYLEVMFPGDLYMRQVHVNLNMRPYGYIDSKYDWYFKKKKKRFNINNHSTQMVNEAYEYAEMVSNISDGYDYDLIHGHDWMTYPAAMEVHKRMRKPLVLHIHATEFDRTLNGNVNPEIYEIEKKGLNTADKVIAVSNYTKNLIMEKYGVSEGKIIVAHNGIDLNPSSYMISQQELNRFAYGKKIVIFVGRLTSQKGPDYFIKVAQKISQEVPDALFVVAGNGDMYNQIIMHAGQNGLTGKLLFSGFLRGKQKDFIYKRADLFIMPSVSEPFGIVALEAAAAQTPVIISNQSGVKEVLTNAVSANYWDINDLADKAINILTDDQLRSNLKQNIVQEVSGITWDKTAHKCLSVYNDLL